VLIIYTAILLHAINWLDPQRKTSKESFEPLTTGLVANKTGRKWLEGKIGMFLDIKLLISIFINIFNRSFICN
jgi:hypothetical protein